MIGVKICWFKRGNPPSAMSNLMGEWHWGSVFDCIMIIWKHIWLHIDNIKLFDHLGAPPIHTTLSCDLCSKFYDSHAQVQAIFVLSVKMCCSISNFSLSLTTPQIGMTFQTSIHQHLHQRLRTTTSPHKSSSPARRTATDPVTSTTAPRYVGRPRTKPHPPLLPPLPATAQTHTDSLSWTQSLLPESHSPRGGQAPAPTPEWLCQTRLIWITQT